MVRVRRGSERGGGETSRTTPVVLEVGGGHVAVGEKVQSVHLGPVGKKKTIGACCRKY